MVSDGEIAAFLRGALPALIAVYRFGSTARAQQRPGSDLDIAILATEPIDAVVRFELQERLAARVGGDVDLVDLRRATTVMAMQVISTGIVLAVFEPAAHEAFADYTYSAYARLNEERREILEQIRREGRVYGR